MVIHTLTVHLTGLHIYKMLTMTALNLT